MGRAPCCVKEGLKKGPWTQEEDQKLVAFVKEHGHGNWRSLPKKCGLLRCGKSCRLRWTNYLRPDIKRGLFTHIEEQKIIQLHSLVGNKWAFIASQLPKRTDNEIKNYWNTVLKKRLEKVGLLSLGKSTTKTLSTLSTLAAERQRQDTKSNVKSSASKKHSFNIYSDKQSNAISSPTSTHLAQWESARLEAEARLSKHSQSTQTHKLFSFSYMGHTFSTSNTASTTTTTASSAFSSLPTITSAFSSLSHNTHTNPQSLHQLSNFLLNPRHTFPSSISNPCLIHDPPTINYPSTTSSLSLPVNSLSNTSSLSLPAIVSMSSSCSASNTSSASSNIVSSKSLNSLSSEESIASAQTLVPSGRLSWQAKESSITTSPNISGTSQLAFISQMLCKIDRHHGHAVELNASTKEVLEPADLKGSRGTEQMSLEATSSMMDLNSTIMEDSINLNSTIMENSMDLNSTMDNWHDLIFDVENSCSDMLSSHATSNSTKTGDLECPHTGPQVPNVQDNGSLDLEGLNLIQFDTLMSCDHYANQHSKELLWDTPTTLSVSSASVVN